MLVQFQWALSGSKIALVTHVNRGAHSPVWPSRIEVSVQVRLGLVEHTIHDSNGPSRIH